MNNRRQTIWLVSMLSLMVILSAYYLFTEDVHPAGQPVHQEAQTEEQAAGESSGVTITQIETAPGKEGTTTDGTATDGTATDEPTTDGAATKEEDAVAGADNEDESATADPAESGTKSDEEVIQGMTSLTGREYFDDAQLRRMEFYDKEEERLNAIIADNKNYSAEETSAAVEDLSRLDAVEQKITSLEEKLTTDYENAVVEEENSNFKVVVQADKLDKAQAVAILDLAAKELEVTPNQLTVQYIPNP
ncbi:SpoIIIAH-like family protein [Cohnella thailandensis]|uniref:SpoIIIAH-like family protein n=1 Tax=Cohnella thailandensis TaxID=557557 RepID=A0A841SX88_9BACL|nr:SpoIIIAH-like family protein [Cohnella thailandensis]MBB6635529.1 SpoIIIAH-like family protein [Cohnella thailandensis]MBP1974909.1 stage III sporulation protein AH [Cohnella thailandensis]